MGHHGRVAGRANTETLLWARDREVADEVNARAPQPPLPRGPRAARDAARDAAISRRRASRRRARRRRAVAGDARDAAEAARRTCGRGCRSCSLAKGLESGRGCAPTQVISEVLPGHPVGLMAGPNLAREVLDGFAAAAVIATPDDSVAQALQPLFATTNFRVYRNLDLLGSELGGVLKNIIAIASGMADGLGVGDNTRALVITRGLAEMTRLGEAMGARRADVRRADRHGRPDGDVHEPAVAQPARRRGAGARPDARRGARRHGPGRGGREDRAAGDAARPRARRRSCRSPPRSTRWSTRGATRATRTAACGAGRPRASITGSRDGHDATARRAAVPRRRQAAATGAASAR